MIPVFRTSHFATLRPLNPTILRTCKRAYDEAIGILYSKNVFMTTDAPAMQNFLSQIGSSNAKLVRSIVLRIYSGFNPAPWGILIRTIAELPTGLRYLQVCWRTTGEYSWEERRPSIERGLGANLDFVRDLAKIRGLEKLVLEGFYAKNWPAYLREQTGAEVQEIVGLSFSRHDLRGRVEMYQQATEHLIP
ncbi:hypothetical protein FQN50_007582 [Emmonsiellopsis sp. PD_5]|nr:hypothetical protein FQN50_007582 [Emmonsiellopsis sp. PD_5]